MSWPTTVVNEYTARLSPREQRRSVRIMRPSEWGSPFSLGRHGDRTEILHLYREWLGTQPPEFFEAVKRELKGQVLVCCCAPLRCHGDFLKAIAEDEPWPALPPRQGQLF
jgi:hypothetical protein